MSPPSRGAGKRPADHEWESPQGASRLVPDGEITPREESDSNGTTVVKIGGSTLGSHDTTLEDLVAMQREGLRPVVVHGGGKVITEWMQRQGVRPRFVRGLRVTDQSSLRIVVAVLTGEVNKSIVASILALGGSAVGLSGVDGGMLRAEVLDPELGLVGSVVDVDIGPVRAIVEAGFIPVIAPVAVHSTDTSSPSSQFLNVNADTAAGEIAAALGAERLVFMTDVEGVMDSSRRLIARLTERQARGLMRSNVIAGGMVPKIGACLKALNDVSTTYIIDGRRAHTLRATLKGEALGTRVG